MHPFRGQPYVTIPLESESLPSVNTSALGVGGPAGRSLFSNVATLQALGYPSPVALVETLYFRERR